MTVIQFPSKTSRSAAASTTSLHYSLDIAPLSVEALCAITQMDLPSEWDVRATTDDVVLSSDDRKSLSAFLCAFGLRLPSSVQPSDLFDMWHVLRYDYGQAVRLAAHRMSVADNLLKPLTPAQMAYACAVGEQREHDAVRLARSLFVGRERLAFLR